MLWLFNNPIEKDIFSCSNGTYVIKRGVLMLRKILLLLDPSDTGLAARHYAMGLAKTHGCSLTGMSILDIPWITAAQPEPLGGSIFKIERDQALIQQSRHHIKELLHDFKEEAAAMGINVTCLEMEGFPSVVIERLSHEHDLIVMGKTTDIHFDFDEDSDIVVRHVARDNPRPVVIVPASYLPTSSTRVVVAQDGGHPAARALHMLLLLGLAQDHLVEVVCIDKDQETAENIAARSVRMCEAYGVKASACALKETKDTAEHILERIASIPAALLCLGGFSHSALKDALFGSTTNRILKQLTIPLFIHH